MSTVHTQETNINDEIEKEATAAPATKDDLDMKIKQLRDQIRALSATQVKVSPAMALDSDGFDNANVDLLQLSHASYIQDLNKYNTIFQ